MKDSARSVRRLFASVAPRYDVLNHLLSLNLDRRWRRMAAQWAAVELQTGDGATGQRAGGRPCVLDLCAGTGDLALALARQLPGARIAALDFVEPMLAHMKEKARRAGMAGRIGPVCADAFRMPFRDATFDLLAVAFGLRNLSPVEEALREMARVIRPGGRLVILEFALPKRGPWGWLYRFYFFRVLPKIGRWISGTSAYSYLPASVALFPEPAPLGRMLEGRGFTQVRWKPMAGGAVAIHEGTKKS